MVPKVFLYFLLAVLVMSEQVTVLVRVLQINRPNVISYIYVQIDRYIDRCRYRYIDITLVLFIQSTLPTVTSDLFIH